MNIIKVRNLLLSAFLVLIIVFIGYKFFEWNTFDNLSKTYNSVWLMELKSTSESQSPNDNLYNEMINNKDFQKPKSRADFVNAIDEVNKKLNIVVNLSEGYGDQLSQDRKLFEDLRLRVNLLVGKRGQIARGIVGNQLSYYDNEQKGNKINLGIAYGLSALLTIWKDSATLADFTEKIGNSTNQTFISQYFANLAPLEKYTDSNFKFDNEDLILKYYPNFAEKLKNYKKYFASYYAAEKDFSVGNTETASLELQSVTDNWANLSIDYTSFGEEQKSEVKNITKNILKIVSNQSSLIKEYKTNKLYSYPVLSNIDMWSEDLVLCQMYNYKSSYYYDVTSSYPTSKTVSDLIKELSTISPKTTNIDDKFDKSVMTFKNSDKRLDFTCKDKVSNTSLKYFITKN